MRQLVGNRAVIPAQGSANPGCCANKCAISSRHSGKRCCKDPEASSCKFSPFAGLFFDSWQLTPDIAKWSRGVPQQQMGLLKCRHSLLEPGCCHFLIHISIKVLLPIGELLFEENPGSYPFQCI